MNTFNTRANPARAKRLSRGKQPAALALNWLVLDETGASVLAIANTLLQAEQVVRKALPPVLAHSCRVAHIDRHCITLAVPGAAHATRVRQLIPTVLRALVKHGWNLNEVELRVQAGLAKPVQQTPPREVLPLDRKALNCFQELGKNLAPGPLADAVARLLAHHGASGH